MIMKPAEDSDMDQIFKAISSGRIQWINGQHPDNEMWMSIGEGDQAKKIVLTATVDE